MSAYLTLQYYVSENHLTPSLIVLPTRKYDASAGKVTLIFGNLTLSIDECQCLSDKRGLNIKCLQFNSVVIYSWQWISVAYIRIKLGLGCSQTVENSVIATYHT